MYQYACVVGCIFLIREFLVVELCCGKLSSERLSLSLSRAAATSSFFRISLFVWLFLSRLFFFAFSPLTFFLSLLSLAVYYIKASQKESWSHAIDIIIIIMLASTGAGAFPFFLYSTRDRHLFLSLCVCILIYPTKSANVSSSPQSNPSLSLSLFLSPVW